MGIVRSFFPGHVRLRCSILKDADIANKAMSAMKELGFEGSFTYNSQTGSILIEYDPKVMTVDKIMPLKSMLKDVMKLREKVLIYSPKNKPFLLSEIDRLKEEAKKLLN